MRNDHLQSYEQQELSSGFPYVFPEHRRSALIAYPLWLFGGFLGLHKLYMGRPLMALVYFLTGGIFALGWLFDFFTLPWQVRLCNLRLRMIGRGETSIWSSGSPMAGSKDPEYIMRMLLKSAESRGGVLTVSEGALATGLPFKKVEKVLKEMQSSGYVGIRNHPETGAVQYVFHEFIR